MAFIQYFWENPIVFVFLVCLGGIAVWFLRWSLGKEAGDLANELDHVEKPKHPDGMLLRPPPTR